MPRVQTITLIVLVSFCMVSDNSCRKHCPMTSLTYFLMHISISQHVIPLCCRHQVVQPCTCKEYITAYNSWLLPHITIQALQHHDDLNYTDQYCIRSSAMLGLGQWL